MPTQWDEFEPVTQAHDWSEFEPISDAPDESGYPAGMPARERRRLDLLTERAAEAKRGEAATAEAEDLASQERTIGAFANPIRNTGNAIGRAAASIAGYGDTYQPSASIIPEELKLHVPADDPSVIAGVGRFGAGLANTFLEPDELLKLTAFGGGAVPKFLATIPMAKELPEQAGHAGTVAGDIASTPADITEAALAPAATGAFLGMLDLIETGERAGLERSAEAAKQVEKSAATIPPERTNASSEPSAEGGAEREVRPSVGEGTSLRQPGEAAPVQTQGAAEVSAKKARLVPAIATEGGKIVTGERHPFAVAKALEEMRAGRISGDDLSTMRQGFYDLDARKFITREEAAKKRGVGGELTSEQIPIEELRQNVADYVKVENALAEARTITGDSNTAQAMEIGARVPKESIPELEKLAQEAKTEADRVIAEVDAIEKPAEADLARMAKASNKSQLLNEAVEAAKGGKPEELARDKGGDIISKLESLKTDVEGGKLYSLPHPDAIKTVAKQAWNDAIDLAIAAVKAGRAIGQAIDEAISYLKKNSKGFDEQQIRANLQYVVGNETKPGVGNGNASSGVSVGAPAVPSRAASVPAAPPAPVRGTGTPQAAGTPAPTPTPPAPLPAGAPVTLADVYARFESAPKAGTPLKQKISEAAEAFRTGFSSKFRPLNKLAEDIAKSYGGVAKDVAGIFEQLKGSSGKAEADILRFDDAVSDSVKGKEKDFNAYLFLRRSLDRLAQDRADAAAGLPARRKVSTYTEAELQDKLNLLESNLGPDQTARFQQAADNFQQQMDTALQLQVTSGRMAPEVYQAIKDGNQFYAPFKVMKYIEESSRPEGSGRRIDTLADYTKAMEGIESPDFKLGDMLGAARQSIAMSRILAEKNLAMRQISDLAGIDTGGLFVARTPKDFTPPKGYELVNVLENGEPVKYVVNSDVAQAVQSAPAAGNILLRYSGNLFRAGATGLNIPFQFGNLLVDQARATLVSKYGINGVKSLINYPLDFVESLTTAIQGSVTKDLTQSTIPDVIGKTISPQYENVFPKTKNKLYLDFLESGAAGATIQESLTPDVFRPEHSRLDGVKGVLQTVPDIAKAIEETSKILGIKRAMEVHNMPTGEDLARFVPEAITEVRRFSGSPDFGRTGKWVEAAKLNIMYMFLNARIQGTVADAGRLTGRDGAKTAAQTWLKMGAAVGLPTAYLYALNNSEKYRKDYEQRPAKEKQNYWLVPKDTFITGPNGEKLRDYWRIPKREIAQWFANATESGLEFARKRDPQSFGNWAQNTIESISPVNIQGNNTQERLESVGSSLNPLVKAPLEVATGRDLYRHQPIVPDAMKKADPELQFKDNTAEIYKTLADKMPDVAPEVFRSPLMIENMVKNMTAGLLTQFLPRKPVEGRTAAENNPLLQRFQALPFSDSTEFDQRIKKFEREAANTQLTRFRNAQTIVEENKNATPAELVKAAVGRYGTDPKLTERVIDLYLANQRNITSQERRILNLPVDERAKFINDELKTKTAEQKAALIRNYALKRIITERVAAAMATE